MEGTSKELDIFKANHGTTIMYHDESDPVFSMCNTVKYYDNLTSKYGAATASFARLFLLPGMNHCQYGSHGLDSFDPLTRLSIGKKRRGPDFMIAGASPSNAAVPASRTYPLCPCPQFAQYAGAGNNSENTASYICITTAK